MRLVGKHEGKHCYNKPQMNLIADGLHITGSDTGTGKVAVFLHGWGNDHTVFDGISAGLSGYRQITPDLPGFGGSQTPKEGWDVERYANFVKTLLSKLEITKVDLLVGHSFGGRIALVLAGNKMIDINELVLIASHGLPEPKSLKNQGLKHAAKLANILPKSVKEKVGRNLRSSDYQSAKGVMRQTFRQIINQDATEQAKAVAIRTLLIYGELDNVTPVEFGQRLHKLISKSQLAVVKGARHHLHQDDSQQVLKIIKDFIK